MKTMRAISNDDAATVLRLADEIVELTRSGIDADEMRYQIAAIITEFAEEFAAVTPAET